MKITYLVMFMAAGVLETGAFSILPCTTRGRMLGKPRAHAARPALRMQVSVMMAQANAVSCSFCR